MELWHKILRVEAVWFSTLYLQHITCVYLLKCSPSYSNRRILSYHTNILQTTVFAGHDASRALGMTSLKKEDVRPDWKDLPETEQKTLDDWMTFFSKRYNIVGVVEGATNME